MLLLGLYLVVKYFGKEWINWALQWYFTIAGVGSGGKVWFWIIPRSSLLIHELNTFRL